MPEGSVASVAFSPDGKTIAAGYGGRDYGRRGGVVLWNAAAHSRLAEDPHLVPEGSVASIAFGPDGKTVAAGCEGSLGVRAVCSSGILRVESPAAELLPCPRHMRRAWPSAPAARPSPPAAMAWWWCGRGRSQLPCQGAALHTRGFRGKCRVQSRRQDHRRRLRCGGSGHHGGVALWGVTGASELAS